MRRILVPVLVIILGACYVHMGADLVGTPVRRPALCREAIAYLAPSDTVGRAVATVARLNAWWPPDMIPSLDQIRHAQRSKAAHLGANAIIWDTTSTHAMALFVPGDSARAAAVCASAQGHSSH